MKKRMSIMLILLLLIGGGIFVYYQQGDTNSGDKVISDAETEISDEVAEDNTAKDADKSASAGANNTGQSSSSGSGGKKDSGSGKSTAETNKPAAKPSTPSPAPHEHSWVAQTGYRTEQYSYYKCGHGYSFPDYASAYAHYDACEGACGFGPEYGSRQIAYTYYKCSGCGATKY